MPNFMHYGTSTKTLECKLQLHIITLCAHLSSIHLYLTKRCGSLREGLRLLLMRMHLHLTIFGSFVLMHSGKSMLLAYHRYIPAEIDMCGYNVKLMLSSFTL